MTDCPECNGECAEEIGRLNAEVNHQNGCVRYYMERSDILSAELRSVRIERDALKAGHDKMCRDLGYCNESLEHDSGYEVPSQQELADLICGTEAYLPERIDELEGFVESCARGEWFPDEIIERAGKLIAHLDGGKS